MSDDKISSDSALHDQHLCVLATQSVRPLDAEDRPSGREMQAMAEALEALSRNPRYQCATCGRAAANRRNLCAPTKLTKNEECHSAGHDRHLCEMLTEAVMRGEPLAHHGGWAVPQGQEALVKDPRFRCGTCGRVAKHEGNLCEPTDISSL